MIEFRRLALIFLSLGLVGLVLPNAARAVGFGPFFEYARGIGVLEEFGDIDFDANRYSVGFAMDTAVARDTLFNYRLNLGYTRREQMFEGASGSLDFNGLTLNNTFGFGVYRDSRIRAWLGPSVRFNADILSDPPSGADRVDLGIGGGFALGINLHTGRQGSAAFTFGYQYLYVASLVSGPGFDETLDGRQHLISFNLTYFFRTSGDTYSR